MLRTWNPETRPDGIPHQGRIWKGLLVGDARFTTVNRADVEYVVTYVSEGVTVSERLNGEFERRASGDWWYVGPAGADWTPSRRRVASSLGPSSPAGRGARRRGGNPHSTPSASGFEDGVGFQE